MLYVSLHPPRGVSRLRLFLRWPTGASRPPPIATETGTAAAPAASTSVLVAVAGAGAGGEHARRFLAVAREVISRWNMSPLALEIK